MEIQQPRNQPPPRRTKFGDGTFLGAPPVVGASRAPQGHLLENLGEVAGLQRASGGTREVKWAKSYPYVGSWGQRDLVKTSQQRYA
jgi:hypothetical protein